MKRPEKDKLVLTPISNSLKLLQYFTFAIILFGFKLRTIQYYGNATPFWDQWDAEGANLYKPFINGKLGFKELFATHNEHRIFTTRLLELALLKINTLWNPLLQMVVNAGLHIGAIILSIHLLLKITGRKYLALFFLFSYFLFIVPYAWENTLGGFQAQFYFVLLFSIAALWLLLTDTPLSKKWWTGSICLILAFFSLASGVFAIAAAVSISIIFYITGVQRSFKQLVAIIILIGLTAGGFLLTPTIAGHAVLKAATIPQFYDAFISTLSWPFIPRLASALARNFPALIFAGILLWKRPPANDKRWFLLALVVWSVGQSMSIAYGRAAASLSSRYLDLFAMMLLINLACFILILEDYISQKNWLAIAGIGSWMFLLFIPMKKIGDSLPGTLQDKYELSMEQEMHVRKYVTSGNISELRNKKMHAIPYPDADRLATILNWQEIRDILPTNIRAVSNPSSDKSGRLDSTIKWMLSHYVLFGIAGMAGLFLIAVYRVLSRKPLNKLL
jgi:hypothetical protein